ncbi:MAG: SatD family protein [Candidatus Cloacimonetes bacterium]|nr:SatD family protein [Candidatus Cloacimonadota bacterium]
MIAVLTCDIIASRTYSDAQRQVLDADLRLAFRDSCMAIPQAKADYLSFSVIQGDEFQFSLEAPRYFYRFLLMFRNRLALSSIEPMPCFRAGIGFGSRSIVGDNSYQMDGSAYHHARSAMNSFSQANFKNRLSAVVHEKQTLTNALNTMLAFCDSIEQGWTLTQRNAIAHAFTQGNSRQIAAILQVSRQNVDKLLKSAQWELISQAMDYFENVTGK